MDSNLYFSDKKYISASRAAEITGYTSDYIGQLSRAKKIKSKLVGKTRYVLESEIIDYKKNFSDRSKNKKSVPNVKTVKSQPATKNIIPDLFVDDKKYNSKILKVDGGKDFVNLPSLVSKDKSRLPEISGSEKKALYSLNRISFEKTDLLPTLKKNFDLESLRYRTISNLNNKVKELGSKNKDNFGSFVKNTAFATTGVLLFLGLIFNLSDIKDGSKSLAYSLRSLVPDTANGLSDLSDYAYFNLNKAVADSRLKFKKDFDFGSNPISFTALSIGSIGDGISLAGGWVRETAYKLVRPWFLEEGGTNTIIVEKEKERTTSLMSGNNTPQPPLTLRGGGEAQAKTVFVQGSDRDYVDQKIAELKNYFLTSPLAPNVNRYYISRQNDVIVGRVSSSGSGSSGSSVSNLSDLSDVSLSSPSYGEVVYYNGSDWANIATSSLGLPTFADLGSVNFGKSWEINSSGFLAPTTTLSLYLGQASSSLLSSNFAQFGATATSTFTTAGRLGIASSSPFARLGVETQAGDIWGFAVGSSTKSLLSVSTEGFGTTTLSGLDISGQATTTSNVGFNITTGCYAIAGTCLSSGGSGASTTLLADSNTFSGTNNFTARLGLATSTPFAKLSVNSEAGEAAFVVGSSTATSLIVDSSGNVGVGTQSPGTALTIGTGQITVPDGSATSPSYAFSSSANSGLYISGSTVGIATAGAARLTINSTAALFGQRINTIGGSSSLPAFGFSNDTNTGMHNPSADNLVLATGGVDRLNINSSGNVGISTSTPYYNLTVASTTGSQLALSAGAGFAQTVFRNDGTNLYISTTTVEGTATTSISALEIALGGFGTTTLRGLNISGQATTTSNVGFNITTGCYAIAGTCLSSSGASTTLLADSNTFSGTNNFTARLGLATSTPFAKLSVNSIAGEAAFVVGSSTATSFIVDASGRVGVGTTSPGYSLGVVGNTSIIQSSYSSNGGLTIYEPGGIRSLRMYIDGNNQIQIDSSTAVSNIILAATGSKVGIGTSTPTWLFNPYSATASQLALSAGTGISQWTFRNAGGNLYLSTTTVAGTATSSISALEIAGDGFGTTTLRGLNISGQATTTSNVGFNITTGCYAIAGTCLSSGGSGASTTLLADTNTWSGVNRFNFASTTYASFGTASTTNLLVNGESFNDLTGAGLAISGSALTVDDVTPAMLQSADFGEFTCNGTNCSLDADTVAESELDLSAVTLADFTNDAGFVTYAWPFTANTGYVSTTTTLGLQNGFFSTASSTVSGDLRLSALSGGFAYIGSTGKVNSIASSSINLSWLNNDAGFLTSLSGAASSTLLGDTNTFSGTNNFTSKLGLGSSTPWAKLSVHANNGETNRSLFEVGSSTASATTTLFTILNNGRVGIGTNNPASLFELQSDSLLDSSLTIDTTSGGYDSSLALYEGGTPRWTIRNEGSNDDFIIRDTQGGQDYFVIQNSDGKTGLATSTPFAKLSVESQAGEAAFVVGSSTATSLIVDASGRVGVGTANPAVPLHVLSSNAPQFRISYNDANYGYLNVDSSGNMSAVGGAAFRIGTPTGELNLANGLSGSDYGRIGIGSSNISYGSQANAAVSLSANSGAGFLRITNTGVGGFNTTTPTYTLTVASTTGPQLSLSAGAGFAQTVFRNDGTNLYISTTTVAGTATTSISALEIALGGFGTTTVRGLNINGQATSTGNVGFNITTGCYAIAGTCLSSSGASTTLLADTNTWSGVNRFNFASTTYGSFGTASTTNLLVNGESFNDLTGAGLTLSGSALTVDNVTAGMLNAEDFGSFTCNGTSCTIDNGAVSNTMLANSTISGIALGSNLADLTATDSTLTFSGSYNGSTARTVGLNLGNANVWTAKQDFFGSASSTLLSANQAWFGGTATTSINNAGLLTIGGGFISQASSTIVGNATTTGTFGAGRLFINSDYISDLTGTGLMVSAQSLQANYDDLDGVLFRNGGNSFAAGGVGTVLGTNDSDDLVLETNNIERVRIMNSGFVGISTSTPYYNLTIASTTGSQLALSAGAGISQWAFRNAGGNLYLSTTTVAGTATSSISALEIAGDGFGTTTVRGLNINGQATSTSNVGFNITTGCYAIAGTCLSSSSGASTTLLADSNTFSGTNNFTSKLGLASSTPFAKLSVHANNGETNSSLFTVGSSTASATTTLFTILNNGRVGIGLQNPGDLLSIRNFDVPGSTNDDDGINVALSSYTVNPTRAGINIDIDKQDANSTSGSITGINLDINNFDDGLANIYGLNQYIYVNPGADVTDLYGTRSLIEADGNITNAYGVYVDTTDYSSGMVNSYGLYVGDLSGTNNVYGVYQSGATDKNYFAGQTGIGTTTPYYNLTVASTTGSQLALSAGAGFAQTVFRNDGTNLYISTTTVEGTATTSVSALEIALGGFGTTTVRGLNISGQATSTSNVGMNITTGCYAVNGTCVGGGGLSSYDAWTHPAAGQSATTSLMLLYGQASSTMFSANQAWFGGTATSTFTSTGRLGIATTTNLNATLTLQGASGLDILRIATTTSGSDVIVISEWGGITQKLSSTTALSIQMASGTPVFEVDTSAGNTAAGIDITASTGQTANLLNFFSSGSTFMSGFTAAGGLFMNMASTSAINIYDGSANAAFVVDSTNRNAAVGTSTLTYDFTVQGSQASTYISRIDNANTGTDADGLLITLGVANASRTTGNYFIGFADGSQTVAGKIQGGASAVAYTTTAADLAEYFRATDPYNKPEPGEIVVLDKNRQKTVKKASVAVSEGLTEEGYEPLGIISTNPGFIGNGPICYADDTNCDTEYSKYNVLVAIAGQVPVRISNENGPIQVGDYLTLSSTTPGAAAKLVGSGYIIGVAVSNATTTNYIRPIQPDQASTTEMIMDSAETVIAFVKSGWREVNNEASSEEFQVPSRWSSLFGFFKNIGLEVGQNFVKIANLIVDKVTAERVETKELCIEDVCIDKTQLQAIVNGAGIDMSSSTPEITPPDPLLQQEGGPEATSTPEIIEEETASSTPEITPPTPLNLSGEPEPEVVEPTPSPSQVEVVGDSAESGIIVPSEVVPEPTPVVENTPASEPTP